MRTHAHTHTHTFNGPLSGTTQVSRYQKGKTNLEQETVSGSGISWAICKSAPRSRQITMPALHYSSFLQTGCPSCRPTNSVKAMKAISNNSHTTSKYTENATTNCFRLKPSIQCQSTLLKKCPCPILSSSTIRLLIEGALLSNAKCWTSTGLICDKVHTNLLKFSLIPPLHPLNIRENIQ